MAGVCFYFEDNDIDVWSGRHIDFDAWNYGIKIAKDIDEVIIVNKTDLNLSTFDSALNISIVNELPTLTGHVTQLVCPWENASNKISLWDFDHKTDWYVYGAANGWGNNYFGDTHLYLPQNGLGATHSIYINTVVMFHRYKTIWQ